MCSEFFLICNAVKRYLLSVVSRLFLMHDLDIYKDFCLVFGLIRTGYALTALKS